MIQWLRHAFAVEPPGPAIPTEQERPVVERMAAWIVRRRMTTPALLFLESSRNLNYIGSQLMVFFAPFAHVLFRRDDYDVLARYLERRGCIEYFCGRIEALEAERAGRARPGPLQPPAP